MKFDWDIFISHASEDKEAIAVPLAKYLSKHGLRVWIDKQQLTLGDSLRRRIDEGLSKSRFGIVILSKNFFAKEWTQKELDSLVSREDGKEKVILPVWHRVSKADVAAFSPLLSDRLAVSTFDGMDKVVQEILKAVSSAGLPLELQTLVYSQYKGARKVALNSLEELLKSNDFTHSNIAHEFLKILSNDRSYPDTDMATDILSRYKSQCKVQETINIYGPGGKHGEGICDCGGSYKHIGRGRGDHRILKCDQCGGTEWEY